MKVSKFAVTMSVVAALGQAAVNADDPKPTPTPIESTTIDSSTKSADAHEGHEYQEQYGKKDEDCDDHAINGNDFNVYGYGKYGNDFGYGYGGGYYGYDPSVYNYAYAYGLGQPYSYGYGGYYGQPYGYGDNYGFDGCKNDHDKHRHHGHKKYGYSY
ncbi:hypothetical protein PR003_g25310 [Phytophthora rubi]|uniref:RxLR effector protein n=1 Tax=Phytophthora rubi TaxID=129364 RepID=A0A6A3IRE9_9STRA|nr:hypothetical protein PR001_g23480 [Phytophthora rubi]KAE9290366.1 hypothetical protein PR003_g25310 [Phytophthora rubi]